jgi:hypothetical protein
VKIRASDWLFPDPPRDFPLRRLVRSVLRAAHILTGGVLLGGYVFSASAPALQWWWSTTLISGVLLLVTDLHASCAVLIEVRGMAVIVKLGLLLMVPAAGAYAVFLLAGVLIIGAISSHLSRGSRHKVLFLSDRVTVDKRRG